MKHIINKVFILQCIISELKIKRIRKGYPSFNLGNRVSYYRPESASENDSDRSYSESWIISQQSSQAFTESEEIYPSAIKSRVSSQGEK
jgi:hypothetical protein